MENEVYVTAHRKRRNERIKLIAEEYKQLMKEDGAMSTVVTEFLMNKYHVGSQATINHYRKIADKLKSETLK